MKIFLFGAGKLYRESYQKITNLKNIEILGIIDNNSSIIGKKINDFYVFDPKSIQQFEFDKIVITNTFIKEIKEQLLFLGISSKKIVSLPEFLGTFSDEKIKFFCQDSENISYDQSVLALTYDIQFDGSTIALQNALLLLRSQNIKVAIVAAKGNEDYIKQLNSLGIDVYLYPYLLYSNIEKLSFINNYDKYLVNTFLMYRVLSILPVNRLAIWWIHEARECYEQAKLKEGLPILNFGNNIKIATVSDVAREIFNEFYPDINCEILHIPVFDWHRNVKRKNNKKIFLLSGYLSKIKGYDIFLDAVELMKEKNCEFWIYGRDLKDNYSYKILDRINKMKNVIYKGEISYSKLPMIYREIYGVIVPSRFETVSMVGIEALMNKKYLVISNSAGLSTYLYSDEAIIFENENSQMLAKILDELCNGDIILNLDKGYDLYKKYFSISSFLEQFSLLMN